jgi:hypothetical protein
MKCKHLKEIIMPYVTRSHGDYKPVANFDTPDYTVGGVNAVTSGVTVQPQGPKLDFFTIALASVATNGTVLATCINTIQQKAVIYMYEVTDTSTDTIAFACYPTGAWTTSDLDTATGGTTTASATFTN